ncbi:hypothetical protein SISNIDRAFT_460116 [Sistotremastrum niveocremeum HHB9708]|uniref:Secreted protein n=2 Tax=Sistotremastraceae TaxID=3402574 RepID=A0A164NV11_9AGAM|nr:hypothetical protein SISNIDRAFT_460116 [Sistotremastrum niveocremeum HHB9708]KZT40508.1 hypothetical protein SISSUDRAFT_1044233 [Sistotremastrum suecicum HHB10207 ss-3]
MKLLVLVMTAQPCYAQSGLWLRAEYRHRTRHPSAQNVRGQVEVQDAASSSKVLYEVGSSWRERHPQHGRDKRAV